MANLAEIDKQLKEMGVTKSDDDAPTLKDAAMFGAEFIPGVGEAMAIKRTSDALDEGDYLGAGVEAAAGLMGLVPGAGDLAGKALRTATKSFRPQKTVKAYKLFTKGEDGNLYPLFVDADTPVKQGEFLEAIIPESVFTAPNGKKYVPSKGTGKKKGTGDNIPIPDQATRDMLIEKGFLKKGSKAKSVKAVALRPGWHAGDSPAAPHIGNEYKGKKFRGEDQVWVEVEMPADVDWQSVANNRAELKKDGTPNVKTAHITDELPLGGYYRYKTNPNMQGNWLISGQMKINRVLDADEVKMLNKKAGVEDLPTLDELKAKNLANGGAVMDDYQFAELEMDKPKKFAEGGLMQEGGTVDPESGNDVPVGSTQEEVRDDIPARLSEGEFVLPADVVRYHGLEKIMELRDEAKAGLQRMEDMGQMGNSDEAILDDDVPFSMDDLELEDDGVQEFQVGGYVQPQNTGIAGYQQSQFANYQPQQAPQVTVPTAPQFQYQAPQQQFTPTVPQGPVPTFAEFAQPTMVTYYNADGATIQIPVDGNGNPLIPVPDGFTKNPPQATQPTTPTATTATSPQQTQDTGGGDDDGFTPDIPKSPMDIKVDEVTSTKEFKEIDSILDTRTGFQKFGDDIKAVATNTPIAKLLGVEGDTTSKEYSKAKRQLAVDIANYSDDPTVQRELMTEITQNLKDDAEREGLAPVVGGYQRNPDGTIKRDPVTGERLTYGPDLSARVESTLGDVTVSEAAKVDKPETVSEAAKLSMPEPAVDPITNKTLPFFESRVNILKGSNIPSERATALTELRNMANNVYEGASNIQVLNAKEALADLEKDNVIDSVAVDKPSTRRVSTDVVQQQMSKLQDDYEREAFGTTRTASAARSKLDSARAADPKQYAKDVRSGVYDDDFATLDAERTSRNLSRNSAPNKVGVNLAEKVGKSAASKIDDRQGTATNVDSQGRIYYDSSHNWGEPTQTNINQTTSSKGEETSDTSGDKIVCTEMYRQTQLADWTQAMKIWGVYEKKYLTPYHEVGYHWLFKPYVRGMQSSTMLTKLGAYLAKERTQHLKHVMTKGRAKDSIVGNLWCKIIHPIVYVAGRIKNG